MDNNEYIPKSDNEIELQTAQVRVDLMIGKFEELGIDVSRLPDGFFEEIFWNFDRSVTIERKTTFTVTSIKHI